MTNPEKEHQAIKAKRTNTSQIGMLGVHLVAAEFIRRGFIVSPTSRGAFGADLLVTDARCNKAWSIQVKTTGYQTANRFNIGKHAEAVFSPTHVYVFVKFKDDQPMFLVVPSGIISKHVELEGGWEVFKPHEAGFYWEDDETKQWRVFGKTNRLKLPVKPGR
jgi:hypothetical protein